MVTLLLLLLLLLPLLAVDDVATDGADAMLVLSMLTRLRPYD